MNKKIKKVKIITLITLIIILIAATIYMVPVMKELGSEEGQIAFKEKVNNAGALGPMMIFALQIAQVVLAVLPGEPVEILAGICFGPVWGTLLLMVSIFFITCAIYFFVKKYGRDFIYEFFPKDKVSKLENNKLFNDEKKIELIMMILFLVPGTPKDLLIYIGGLLPIKSSKFILISTLLRFPSVISSTIAGDSMLSGKWTITILAYVITFVITIAILLIVNLFDKNNTTSKVLKSMKKKDLN